MVYMNKTFARIDIRDGKWKSVNKYMGRIKSVIKNVNDYETALNILKQDRLEARKLKTDDAKHFYYNVIDIVEHRVNALASLFLLDLKEQQDLYLNRDTDAISKYRYECRFKVNLSNVHSVKGYELLLSSGLYDKSLNPNGVVKDHRVSIKFGFDNKISPNIIGHLKNCEFLPYKQNAQKSSNSSTTIEKLLLEISTTDELDKQAKLY